MRASDLSECSGDAGICGYVFSERRAVEWDEQDLLLRLLGQRCGDHDQVVSAMSADDQPVMLAKRGRSGAPFALASSL